jgi:PTH1 family peptidyl-tRNA hydrolase
MMVVVGLGNPGRTYASTRHNAGAQCLQHLAVTWDIPLQRRGLHALLGQGTVHGQEVALARPRSYMNLNGEAVAYLVRRFRITPQQLLLLYDDMDLPLGSIRLRPRGGPGGHRGVGSAIDALNTQELPRLRVGIGRPPTGVDEVAYVLGAFTPEEEEVMRGVRERVAQAVGYVLSHGLEAAMNRFNAAAPEPGTP